MQQEAGGRLKGLVGYTEEPHASVDFNTDPRSAIVDGTQTKVCGGRLIKMLSWFDNEWGFASRMLDVANHWLSLGAGSWYDVSINYRIARLFSLPLTLSEVCR